LGGKGLDEVQKMIPTKDGGCLVGIYSRFGLTNKKNDGQPEFVINNQSASINYFAKTSNNEGQGDYGIAKLDKNGTVQWEKNFGGAEDDHIKTLIT
jgi:hypothetical protein